MTNNRFNFKKQFFKKQKGQINENCKKYQKQEINKEWK